MQKSKKIILLNIIFIFFSEICIGLTEKDSLQNELKPPFQGEIKVDSVNVRSDSTTTAPVICTLDRTQVVDVVQDSYDWYKIKLPKTASVYIKKNLVSIIDDSTIKVIKENVNIRLGPSEQTAIVGKVNKGTSLRVITSEGDWFKIEPPESAFGWVHKKFVLPFRAISAVPKEEKYPKDELMSQVSLEGILQPNTATDKKIASHRLIHKVSVPCSNPREKDCVEEKIYFLKGTRKALRTLNQRRVKVTGRIIGFSNYPIVQIDKIEPSE